MTQSARASGTNVVSARLNAQVAASPATRTNRDDADALAEDEAQHVARLRAERHADADLARAQAGAEGDDAVDADERQRDAEQPHPRGLHGADLEQEIPEDAR